MSKGQVFTADFMASVAILGLSLAVFATMWNLGISSQVRFSDEEQLKSRSERAADFLVTTSGYPENWEDAGVEVSIPGFASSQNVLSVRKIEEFASIDYDNRTSMLNVRGFSIQFRNTSGNIMDYEDMTGDTTYENQPFNQGQPVPEDAETVVKVKREAALNISGDLIPAEVNYITWR